MTTTQGQVPSAGGSAGMPAAEAPRGNGRVWTLAVLLAAVLGYLAWAGSSYDPRKWPAWIIDASNWFVPVPGLAHRLIAGFLAVGVVAMLAWRARGAPPLRGIARGFAVAFLLLVSLNLHLVLCRWWTPLVVDPLWLASGHLPTVRALAGWRIAASFADVVTTGILLLALQARGRSPWLAAVFALHPLALSVAGGATGGREGVLLSLVLPAVVLLAMPWRWQRWVRHVLMVASAAAVLAWSAQRAFAGLVVDGVLAQLLAGLGGRAASWVMVGVTAGLEGAVLVLAFRHRWEVAKVWSHLLVIAAITMPRVLPADVLPVLALLVLAPTRAGWVLTTTILGTAAYAGMWTPGTQFEFPLWLTFLIIVPVAVTEIQELWMEAFGGHAGAWAGASASRASAGGGAGT